MNLRLLLSALFLGLAFPSLFAQTFRPLSGYEQLREPVVGKLVTLDKTDCGTFDLTGFNVVLPGETKSIKLRPDTVALDGVGFNDYRCEGCDEVDFGTAFVRNDSLFYGADAGAEFGLDTVLITACTAADVCSTPLQVIILVRREGREISLSTQSLNPRERTEVVVPSGQVPGGATCRSIESCAPNYPGREQFAGFLTGQADGNDFFYEAAGYNGTDEVCVTLCNDFGLCDVYKATFVITVPAVDLPFFDDFSYEGVRPDEQLWQDEDVLINRNFAQDPPSIGVATFDGVDFAGQAYPAGSGGQTTVIRDYLTSAPVNLGGKNGTTLNFYLQPRGFGNRPETQDSFLVQFLDNDGNWNTVYRQEGILRPIGTNVPLPFEGKTLPVPNEYLYDGFQFRFASKSSEQGAVDMWHLDYVKLDNNSTTLVTQDMAFAEIPDFLPGPYSSMPLRHLRAGGQGLFRDSIRLELFNHEAQPIAISSSAMVVRDVTNNRTVTSGSLLAPTLFFNGINNEVAAETRDVRRANFRGWANFNEVADYLLNQVADADPVKLDVSYRMQVITQALGFARGISRNDTVRTTTYLDEYMAYDDGTAELAIEGQEGTTILQRYEAFIADELTGVRVRIPRGLGGLGDQQIRLVVYTGDTVPTDLVAEYDFPIRYAEDLGTRDSLQAYTTYVFPERLALATGNFYVGWQQQRASRQIGIGFDRNQTPEDVQWFNTGSGGWKRLRGTTTGAIMIRPLLSGFEGFTTDTNDPSSANEPLVDVYPNPTNGALHLRPRQSTGTTNLSYRLYSMTGALLGENRLTERLEIGHLPAGLYLLEVTDGVVSSWHKIVRR